MGCKDWSRCAVFDIDGVLIDSKKLVRRAYELAGVSMPDHAWGLPWQDWLPELVAKDDIRRVRVLKQQMYLKLLRSHVPRLPAADVASALEMENHAVKYVTGASADIAPYVLGALHLSPSSLAASESDLAAKTGAARYMMRRGWRVVYVDDDPNVRVLTVVPWVHYQGQDTETLRKEMEEAWTRSS